MALSEETVPNTPAASKNWWGPAMLGYLVIAVAFLGLGGWSAFARVDSAVIAQGVVAVESNRKTVQHLEGGIVRKINVHEGSRVAKDEILFELEPTAARSSLAIVQNQLDASLAQEARLMAERDGRDQIAFPDDLLSRGHLSTAAAAMADQQKQFDERRESLGGQLAILRSRISQKQSEIEGIDIQLAAVRRQLVAIDDELESKRALYKQQLISKTQILALDREKARLDGLVGEAIASGASAASAIGETELQIKQVGRQFLEDVSTQMLEARQNISDARERVAVGQDVFSRLVVRAPLAGYVQNMRIFTVGAVIQTGQALLDIIPLDEPLIIQARVSPLDIESLSVGMQVEVRFPSFNPRTFPLMFGEVTSVSTDHLTDEKTGQSYFLAQVEVDNEKVAQAHEKLMAGLPAEILAATGERTVLEYLIDPLTDRLRHSFREH